MADCCVRSRGKRGLPTPSLSCASLLHQRWRPHTEQAETSTGLWVHRRLQCSHSACVAQTLQWLSLMLFVPNTECLMMSPLHNFAKPPPRYVCLCVRVRVCLFVSVSVSVHLRVCVCVCASDKSSFCCLIYWAQLQRSRRDTVTTSYTCTSGCDESCNR